MVLDVVDSTVNNYYLFEIPIQIFEIFDELPVFPDHSLATEYPANVHLFGVNLHNFAHNGVLIFFGKYDYFVFLGQSSQHLLQTWTKGGFYTFAENVLTFDYGACEVENESFGVEIGMDGVE